MITFVIGGQIVDLCGMANVTLGVGDTVMVRKTARFWWFSP